MKKKSKDEQRPTCVNRHSSINSEALQRNSVAVAFARCHDEERDDHPADPEKAWAVLNCLL